MLSKGWRRQAVVQIHLYFSPFWIYCFPARLGSPRRHVSGRGSGTWLWKESFEFIWKVSRAWETREKTEALFSVSRRKCDFFCSVFWWLPFLECCSYACRLGRDLNWDLWKQWSHAGGKRCAWTEGVLSEHQVRGTGCLWTPRQG